MFLFWVILFVLFFSFFNFFLFCFRKAQERMTSVTGRIWISLGSALPLHPPQRLQSQGPVCVPLLSIHLPSTEVPLHSSTGCQSLHKDAFQHWNHFSNQAALWFHFCQHCFELNYFCLTHKARKENTFCGQTRNVPEMYQFMNPEEWAFTRLIAQSPGDQDTNQ